MLLHGPSSHITAVQIHLDIVELKFRMYEPKSTGNDLNVFTSVNAAGRHGILQNPFNRALLMKRALLIQCPFTRKSQRINDYLSGSSGSFALEDGASTHRRSTTFWLILLPICEHVT